MLISFFYILRSPQIAERRGSTMWWIGITRQKMEQNSQTRSRMAKDLRYWLEVTEFRIRFVTTYLCSVMQSILKTAAVDQTFRKEYQLGSAGFRCSLTRFLEEISMEFYIINIWIRSGPDQYRSRPLSTSRRWSWHQLGRNYQWLELSSWLLISIWLIFSGCWKHTIYVLDK